MSENESAVIVTIRSLPDDIERARQVLTYIEDVYQDVERLIMLVYEHRKFFGADDPATAGKSMLTLATDKLEEIVVEHTSCVPGAAYRLRESRKKKR